jgi:ribosomal protein L19E
VPVSVNKKDDEVRTIVAKLLKTGYHRVWIINSKRKPVSDFLLNLLPFH